MKLSRIGYIKIYTDILTSIIWMALNIFFIHFKSLHLRRGGGGLVYHWRPHEGTCQRLCNPLPLFYLTEPPRLAGHDSLRHCMAGSKSVGKCSGVHGTYMQWPPSVRCPSMAQTLGIAIQCRWESWLWKPGWSGQVKEVGHGWITVRSCKKSPSCGLSRSNWFPSPRLGNAWTTHGRWSPHVGLTASCLPWTVTHPSTNQARRCLTWSFGAWYALNLNITS